jgi:hypothetical protein
MVQTKTQDPIVAEMLKQYENTQSPKQNTTKTFDLKNYFSIYLPDGVNTGTKRIRILPSQGNGNPFSSMQVHTRQVNGKWQKYTCLKHNNEIDKDCPFCEARQELLASGKESDKELAKKFGNRKMHILRVIDRDHEEDGIKFWRFNLDYRNKGIYDNIISIVKVFGNISDAEKGRDLIINIGRDHKKNCVITGLVHCDPSPALEDKGLLTSLTEDKRTWQDIYAIKDYSYLEIIVLGGEPVYDKNNKMWVDKATLDGGTAESNAQNANATFEEKEIVMGTDKLNNPTEITMGGKDIEDDLPF